MPHPRNDRRDWLIQLSQTVYSAAKTGVCDGATHSSHSGYGLSQGMELRASRGARTPDVRRARRIATSRRLGERTHLADVRAREALGLWLRPTLTRNSGNS